MFKEIARRLPKPSFNIEQYPEPRKYFEGINFTPLVQEVPSEENRSNEYNDRSEDVTEENGKIDVAETIWSRKKTIADFRDLIGNISGITGAELPLDDIAVFFVRKESLIPKDLSVRIRLSQRYGPYILDGIGGDCTSILSAKNSRYRFMLRIGAAKSSETHEKVLERLSHEYGHTLGYIIKDPVFEEMQAYAFMALFMRYYTDVDQYLVDGVSPDRVHDVARHNVGLLQAKGVKEEEAIAHLIREPFGTYQPDDYKHHLNS